MISNPPSFRATISEIAGKSHEIAKFASKRTAPLRSAGPAAVLLVAFLFAISVPRQAETGEPASDIRPMMRPENLHPLSDKRPEARPEGFSETVVLRRIPEILEAVSDHTCLSVAIYHEARGESPVGRRAVGSVIIQRAATPGRWGKTICDVVSPTQFSFLERDRSFPAIKDHDAWIAARRIASDLLMTGPDSAFERADHYHSLSASPSWASSMNKVSRIGKHIFYSDPRSDPPD